MKRWIYFAAVILAIASGCKKTPNLIYSDVARVQLNDTTTAASTFFYEAANVTKDTIYVQVNTIGGITDYDRPVKLVQVPEYDYTYVRDPVTNQVTDTIATERPFKAMPGVHYMALDDKSLAPVMMVKANTVSALIPIVMLRDASMKDNSYRLRIQLAANSEFGLGEQPAREKTLILSDRLERFYSWRVDGTQASAYNTFGRYSQAKHAFMYATLKVVIDEAWYQAIVLAQATNNYQNLLRQALIDYNNDPTNIASGKAPLRETSAPNSPLVTF